MTIEPLLAFFTVIAIGYVVLRWETLILPGYALCYLATAQWTGAALALVFACFVEFMKRLVIVCALAGLARSGLGFG